MSTGSAKAELANSASTSNTSGAATAVFAVPELLFLVLEAVLRRRRTSLRQVSKSWRAAVMKLGYVIEPIGYLLIPDFLRPWLPLYRPDIVFKINQVLSNYVKNESTGNLDTISCRTEKTILALELPGGPSVIHFNLRVEAAWWTICHPLQPESGLHSLSGQQRREHESARVAYDGSVSGYLGLPADYSKQAF
jgi:hypothetical protein